MSMDETIVSSLDDLKHDDKQKDPYLIIVVGKHVGKLYHLNSKELVAGRSPDSDIWIEDNTISRKHFRIIREDRKSVV